MSTTRTWRPFQWTTETMTDGHPSADCHTEIDRRLEAVFESGNDAEIPLAQRVIQENDDRWYGQLVVGTVGSVTRSVSTEAVLSAAAAIELLRGYCRLRSELLVQVSNDVPHSLTRDPTSALLAGDLLFSVAYSELGAVDHTPTEPLFETLANVSGTVIEALTATHVQSTSAATDRPALIDDTAGALGEGATLLGASLAGVTDSRREQFASVGRGLGVARQIRRDLDSDGGSLPVVPPEPDEATLRRHANRRMEEATCGLDTLSPTVDVDHLRPFFERIPGCGGSLPD